MKTEYTEQCQWNNIIGIHQIQSKFDVPVSVHPSIIVNDDRQDAVI